MTTCPQLLCTLRRRPILCGTHPLFPLHIFFLAPLQLRKKVVGGGVSLPPFSSLESYRLPSYSAYTWKQSRDPFCCSLNRGPPVPSLPPPPLHVPGCPCKNEVERRGEGRETWGGGRGAVKHCSADKLMQQSRLSQQHTPSLAQCLHQLCVRAQMPAIQVRTPGSHRWKQPNRRTVTCGG